jgi:hypothetical protein
MPTRFPASARVKVPNPSAAPCMQGTVGPYQATEGHQHQRQGDISYILGQYAGRVRHLQASLPTGRERHTIIADAIDGQDLQCGQSIQQLQRNHRSTAHDDATNVRSVLLERVLKLVRGPAGTAGERFFERTEQELGHGSEQKQGGMHLPPLPFGAVT